MVLLENEQAWTGDARQPAGLPTNSGVDISRAHQACSNTVESDWATCLCYKLKQKNGLHTLLGYFNLAMGILFPRHSILWCQFFLWNSNSLRIRPGPSGPNHHCHFRRLTNIDRSPITATAMRFRLYDTGPGTGGSILWDSGSCSIDPDQDGIFFFWATPVVPRFPTTFSQNIAMCGWKYRLIAKFTFAPSQ